MQEKLELIPLSKWNNYYPFPTVGALRQHLFKNTNNIVKRATRKIGNRIYIKVSSFFEWVEENNKGEF